MPDRYRISELAEKAGVTKRTIHYYISKGLLPPPEGAGVGSVYFDEHLVKLMLIKKLQNRYLPLEKIRRMVSGLSLEQARRMLAGDADFDRGADTEGLNLGVSAAEPFPAKDHPDYPAARSALAAAPALKKPGPGYIRSDLGLGVELHCPLGVYERHGDLISAIERYARKLLDEK